MNLNLTNSVKMIEGNSIGRCPSCNMNDLKSSPSNILNT